MTDRDAGKILYSNGFEQKEIARLLRKSEPTISKWKNEDNWELSKVSNSVQTLTATENSLAALNHQTRVLKLMADRFSRQLEDELARDAEGAELAKYLIPKGEIDAVQKLFTTIKRPEAEWSTLVKVLRDYANWLRDENLSLAQQNVEYMDIWLNDKRKSL